MHRSHPGTVHAAAARPPARPTAQQWGLTRLALRAPRTQAMVEETLLLSWTVQQLGHKVDLLLNSRLPAESWLNFESESRKKFASAYSKLGGKTPVRFEAKAGGREGRPASPTLHALHRQRGPAAAPLRTAVGPSSPPSIALTRPLHRPKPPPASP